MSSPLAALKSHLCIVPVSGSPLAAATFAARFLHRCGLRQLFRQSLRTLAVFLVRCIGSPACPTMSDAAVDTSSEITTKVRLDAARPFGVRAFVAGAVFGAPRLGFPEPAVALLWGAWLRPPGSSLFVCAGEGAGSAVGRRCPS